ncbi:MAG: branched-chain amino acid aminotransferase [Actinomycetota bacterium]|nr:branched-chain amino acid aminotransferase [Actinomycetota bacterium]
MTATSIPRHLVEPPVPAEQRTRLMADPGFGRVFTPHMVTASYDPAAGWHGAEVVPFGALALSPASAVLHYGQAIFEGLKAYAQPDGSVAVFRPQANAARFTASARRMAIPELPEELFLAAVDELVDVDRDWVPDAGEANLYLRPVAFADDEALPVRPSERYRFVLMASPVGSYFPRGVAPVTVWLSTDFSRAAPGGTGAAKCPGNYGGSLLAQAQAHEHGCDQVVWLDPVEHSLVEELGGMNIFFVERAGDRVTLVTPPLTGTLLPGVVRASLLTLAGDLGYGADEEPVTVERWEQGCRSGRIAETFACGTAAVVTPVGEVRHATGGWTVGDGGAGAVTLGLRRALLDIQMGRAPDRHGWMHTVAATR